MMMGRRFGSWIVRGFRQGQEAILSQVDQLDSLAWLLVLLFFGVSAWIGGGDILKSLWGALQIILLMFLISTGISILLSVVRGFSNAGQWMGFLTNGPELILVIVGLLNRELLMGVSAPLGSSFYNPLWLLLAAAYTHQARLLLAKGGWIPLLGIGVALLMAGSFYVFNDTEPRLWLWIGLALLVSGFIFAHRGTEEAPEEKHAGAPLWLALPGGGMVALAGYVLDEVIQDAARVSHLQTGWISFIVMGLLASWPEFRSTVSLMRINRRQAALSNILISNLINLWLVALGTAIYLLFL